MRLSVRLARTELKRTGITRVASIAALLFVASNIHTGMPTVGAHTNTSAHTATPLAARIKREREVMRGEIGREKRARSKHIFLKYDDKLAELTLQFFSFNLLFKMVEEKTMKLETKQKTNQNVCRELLTIRQIALKRTVAAHERLCHADSNTCKHEHGARHQTLRVAVSLVVRLLAPVRTFGASAWALTRVQSLRILIIAAAISTSRAALPAVVIYTAILATGFRAFGS